MTRTVTVSLGHSPLSGKQAMDQCSRFKSQLRSLQAKPESVTLLTVVNVEPPSMSVAAMHDADDTCAVEWVKMAEGVAGEVWKKLADRRRTTVR